MRELALSMDFDMSRYQNINENAFNDSNNNQSAESKQFSQRDQFDSIVKNIDSLIHSEEHGEIDIK